MIGIGAFTVFVIGLRHGADPDHLAAIDNVTRNAYPKAPRLSRFVGTMFAGGHSLMVLAISALVGMIGARFTAQAATIELVGTWVSILVLVAIAAANIRQLTDGREVDQIRGVKTRLLPRALRDGTSAFLAIPIGLLFGFGFETSSQIAAYAVAFGADAGVAGAVLVGAMFCAGMIVTDTLDSVLVHRLIAFRSTQLPRIMRVWLWSVTMLALVVAAYEVAGVFGWHAPFTDLQLSAVLCTALAIVFAYVFVQTRRTAPDTHHPAISQGEGP